MSRYYEPITHEQMNTLLVDLLGFEWVDIGKQCKEFVYERATSKVLDGHPMRLRVYSSIDQRNNMARASGRDAIRVVLMWKDRAINGGKRVVRIKSWAKNLIKRIESMEDGISDVHICASCMIPMIQKRGKFGRFMGCPNFPTCRHTVDL